MHSDYVMCWWMRGEFAEQRGDWQTGANVDQAGSDLLQDDTSIIAMQNTPLGEPPTDFDVRCIFDSRPVNGYDFNMSQILSASSAAGWSAEFMVPNGYRAVPRKWEVYYDGLATGLVVNSYVQVTQNNAALPNSTQIYIGHGTDYPIETFFVCEENTVFGMNGINTNLPGDLNVIVQVYGNLIPVTDVALPFAVANQERVANTI